MTDSKELQKLLKEGGKIVEYIHGLGKNMKKENKKGKDWRFSILCILLTITFIILKLIGEISWSWLWILAPLWIPPVIFIIACFIAGFFVIYRVKKEDEKK